MCVATAQWNLPHALLGLGEHASAQGVALGVICAMERPSSREVAAITGALWLTAAITALLRGTPPQTAGSTD